MRPSSSLAFAAIRALATSSALPVVKPEGWTPKPVDTGRRAEKDALALAKAEAKRQRRAAKRARG